MLCVLVLIIFSLVINQSSPQSDQIKLLSSRHKQLLEIFSLIDSNDFSEYLSILNDDIIKEDFFNALEVYDLTLSLALSNDYFILNTPEKIVQTYKNDSKFFSQLKSKLIKNKKTKIINIYSYQEEEQYNTVLKKISNGFEGKRVLSFKYSKLNMLGYADDSDQYKIGNSLDLMIFNPGIIKIFGMQLFTGYNLNFSNIPALDNGNDLKINKVSLHLINYLDRFPISIDTGFGIMKQNIKGYGFCMDFDLSYYIPIELFILSINLTYEKFMDVKEDYKINFESQDFIGLNLRFEKNIIFK